MTKNLDLHICAYIDFLGGREINRSNNPELIERFFETIFEFERRMNGVRRNGKPVVKTFSDNIFAAIEITPTKNMSSSNWVDYFLYEIAVQVQQIFLMYELPLRGGITIGDMVINEKMVFGPAVVASVELEERAHFPRILLDSNVIDALSPTEFEHHPLVYHDEIGVASLNYLSLYPWFLKPHKELIARKLEEFQNVPKVRTKYEWLEKYHIDIENRMRSLNLTT